ncbi:MAG: TonB-dependent receptor [Bryobacteraceae bacterium]
MSQATRLSFAIFCLCFSGLRSSAHAAELRGIVRDPQNSPVPDARITLVPRTGGLRVSTVSAQDGSYRFESLAPADYLIQTDARGFAQAFAGEISLTRDASAQKDLAVSLAAVREQILVTASIDSQPSGEVARTISTVTSEDVRTRDSFSLADAISPLAGVRAQQLGGPGALTTIRIRGMRNQDTAVLVDGMRLRDASAIQSDASGFIQDLLFTNARRVEVMNGPGSSLYGTSAIGGVVNVVTDEGGGNMRGSFLAEGGSLGLARSRATVAGGLAHDRVQYSAGLAHVNATRGLDGDDAFRDTSFQGRIGTRIGSSSILHARLFAADSFGKLNGGPGQTGVLPATGIVDAVAGTTFVPAPNDSDSTRAGRFLSGALVLDGQLAPRLAYQVAFQTLASGRRYGNGTAGFGFQPFGSTRTVYDSRIQTANARVSYSAAHQAITAGYEFENENYAFHYADRSDPAAASAVNATQRSNAFYLQDQVKLFDGRLLITGGVRAQYFVQLNRPVFAPAVSSPYAGTSLPSPPAAYTGDGSAAYILRSTHTKIRAHVGRGYRAPSLYERFGSSFDSYFGYSNYGDPRLKPEHSLGFDAGVDQDLYSGRVRLSSSYFYSRLQDTIAFGPTASADPYGRIFGGYINSKGGLSRGVEVSARVSPLSSLDVTTAYTFVNAAERAPLYAGVLRTFVIPRHQFSAVVTQRLGKRMVLTLDTIQSGNSLAPIFGDFVTTFETRVYRFGGMRRINAGISYRLPLSDSKAVRFYMRAENLTGQKYYETGYRTPGRTAVGGMQFEF